MPIVRVGQDTLRFPDSMSQAEIKAALDKRYGNEQQGAQAAATPMGSQVPVQPREPDLIDRMGGAISEGWQGAKDAFSAPQETLEQLQAAPAALGTSPAERTQEALSSVLGGVGNAAGEALEAGWKTFVPDPVQEFVSETAESFMGLEPVQDAVAYAKEFAEENPNVTERAGDVANLSALVAPKARFSTRTKVGRRLDDINAPYADARRTRLVEDMLVDKDVADFELSRTGSKEYEIPQWTKEVAEEVKTVKGLSPTRSAAHNQAVLRKEAKRVREGMERQIKARGNPKVDVDQLQYDLEDIVKSLPDQPEAAFLSGSAPQKAQQMLTRFLDDLKKSDGTALSVMQARRDFDKWVRKQTNSKVYDPEVSSAVSYANKQIRDKINEAVDQSVKGVSIRKSLDKQHKLLTAQDTLLAKARKEREGVVGRLVQKVENATSLHMPTTPVAVAAIPAGAAGFAAGAPAAAATLAAALAAYGGYRGGRWLLGSQGRQWIIRIIKTIEADPFLSRTFKADRLALLDILNQSKPEEEESE